MVTIDASVWVAADAADEAAWEESRAFFERILAEGVPVHQPTLTLVEVSAAVARRTGSAVHAREAGTRLLRFPGLVVHPLDLELAGLSAALAARLNLRGADAVYAATARAHGADLVTLDRELVDRAPPLVGATTPGGWGEAPG
ncbi:MAG: type II toxin-antitoxin system VapC family toxin [Gemmatimonadales bacterium]|nr:MAG: type II toxin-antitoxin system VapC family toxin [Gemmatimonadales bacterium]